MLRRTSPAPPAPPVTLLALVACGLSLSLGPREAEAAGEAGAPGATAAPTAEDWNRLRDGLTVLTEEVARLRTRLEVPETDEELESIGGLGPAASRVYGSGGLSIGGYGEFYFAAPTGRRGSARTADLYRFITYVGYEFDERWLMNTELEFEHATTSANADGRSGSVSVEFSVLEFRPNERTTFRAGNLLIPVGLVNRMHEPPFYRGNFRPTVERSIIPSTWRELGVSARAESFAGLSVEAAVVNGLDASGYGSSGIRDGRQKGNRARWEDVAGVLAIDWEPAPAVRIGGSGFAGGAGQGRSYDGEEADAFTVVTEGHVVARHRGFEARALIAATTIDDAERLGAELGELVPERQLGGYVEGAWDVAPHLGRPAHETLRLWTRWEDWNLQRAVPDGRTADPALDGSHLVLGVEYGPHPQVVIKADVTLEKRGDDAGTEDPFRLGAGFVF